ncbi:MAG: Indigoidine synthase A like protein-domain-containing protein [Podila humilis]|nr:MAG: Indigoidine synthase A like protein-domain-containing protein [Podila humilis]
MLRASLALPRHGVRATTLTRLTPFSTSATKLRQQQSLAPVLNFSDEVKAALANNKPIVALESTIISHGMPYPQNYETAIQVESVVRENGATPATIAILDGQIQIGLSNSQIQNLAELGRESVKASRRDLAVVMSKKQTGATTVSATMLLAHRAGISVFATGGIGGVHRGYEETLDASADLTELGRTPVAVVCAGVKSILDIGRTLEFLETEGVTVATYGQTTDFPAFFTRKSGFQSLLKVETPLEAAKLIAANHAIDLQSGIVFAVPIAKEHAMDDKVVSDAIDTAIRESVENNVLGKESTPFLLKRVNELTGGNSLKSNIALVKQNAAIAAKIAKDLSKLSGSQARTYSTSARVFNRHTEHDTSSSAHGPIMVIGGTVVDITSTADPARLVSGQENDVTMNSMIHSSHPGATRISLGGVGRNVAEVISRLDNQNCVFVSAVGGQHVPGQGSSATDDLFGPWLVSEVARRGMDNHEIHPIRGARTATYTAIHDSTGNLLSAVADMGVFELLPPSKIKEAIAKHKPRTICFDANISVECMKATLEACRGQDIHTFFEPTSVAKCGRVLDSTMAASLTDGLLRFATPNEYELQEMATHARKLMSNNPDDVLIKGLGDRAIVRGHHDMDSVTTKESESQDLQKEYTSLLLDAFSVSHFIPTLFIKLGAKGVLVFQRSQLNAYQESRQCKDFKVERLDLEQSKVISDEKGGQDMSPFTVTWRSFPANKVSGIKSVTGAGDSLVGSVVTSLHHLGDLRVLLSENKLVQGRDRKNGHSTTGVDPFAFWKQMDRVISDAQAAAALTMQTHETVSPSLSTSPQATLLASKPKVISS